MNKEGRGFLVRLLKWSGVLGLILISGLWVAWHFKHDAIIAKVLDLAELRLADRGLYIERASHQITLTRGIVLQDILLFADEEKNERVASFSNLGVWVPIWDLFSDDATLRFSAESGELRFETSAGPLNLEDLNFELNFTKRELIILHLSGDYGGLHISASGALKLEEQKAVKRVEVPDLSGLIKAGEWIDFPVGSPTLGVRFVTAEDGRMDIETQLSGTDFRWRDFEIDSAEVPLVWTEGAVSMPGFSIDCYGGNLSGDLVVDYAHSELRLEKIVSSADFFRLVEVFAGKDARKGFRVEGETLVIGDSVVFDLSEFGKSRGDFELTSEGLVVPSTAHGHHLGNFVGSVRLMDESLVVEGKSFSIHGGRGSARFTMPLAGGFRYKIKMDTNGVSLARLGVALGLKDPMQGYMDLAFNGGGTKGLKSHYGTGRVEVSEGNFYSVPFFGSLRRTLTEHLVEFGNGVADDLSMDFSLKNGVLRSSNMRIESDTTVVLVKGSVNLSSKTVNVDVRANLKGVTGLVTEIVSMILEMHGEGPVDRVTWNMKSLMGVPKATGNAVKGVIDGVGEAAGGLLDALPFGKRKKPDKKK